MINILEQKSSKGYSNKGDAMKDKIKISSYIKSRRENLGMSQYKLAEKLNVNRSLVSRWEAGISQPSVDNFVKVCDVLGMQIGDFIGKDT